MLESETVATQRKKRVKKYFTPSPAVRSGRRGLALLGVGALALGGTAVLFLSGDAISRVVALVVLAVGVTVGFRGLELTVRYHERLKASEPKPTDAEMDDLLAQDLIAARGRALRRLHLTDDEIELPESEVDPITRPSGDALAARRDGEPLVVYGPGWMPYWPTKTRYAVIAGDGYWRFQEYEIMIICPTERHLALYVCSVDTLTGGISSEDTFEYHYVDIVAVRTSTIADEDLSFRYLDRKHADEVHFARKLVRTFEIVVSSGDRAAVPVGIVDVNHPDHEEMVQRVSIDAVVNHVRKLLRDKKASLPGSTSHAG